MKRACQITILLLAAMVCAPPAHAQAKNPLVSGSPARPGAAQGELTVTLTIVPSVGVVLDESGQPKLIVANAPDPADNVSTLRMLPAVEKKKDNKPRK